MFSLKKIIDNTNKTFLIDYYWVIVITIKIKTIIIHYIFMVFMYIVY